MLRWMSLLASSLMIGFEINFNPSAFSFHGIPRELGICNWKSL